MIAIVIAIDIVIGRRDKVITEMSKESGGGYAYLAKSFEEGLARRIVSQGGLFIFMDEEGLVQTKHYNSNVDTCKRNRLGLIFMYFPNQALQLECRYIQKEQA